MFFLMYFAFNIVIPLYNFEVSSCLRSQVLTVHNILVHVYLIDVNGREVSASGINTLAMWMLEHPESGAEPAPTKSREMNRRGSLESLDRRGLRYFTERCSTVNVELYIHVNYKVRS